MTEQDWTVTPEPQPVQIKRLHKAEVDGLAVQVTDEGTNTSWRVAGWLADVPTSGSSYFVYGRSAEDAKTEAVAAAHRLYAAGVRATKSYPVECCDRTFATADAADQHESEHRAAAVAAVQAQADSDAEAALEGAEPDIAGFLAANVGEPERPAGGRVIHVTAQVDIEDGQEGRYRIGRVDTDEPWWVVDCAPGAVPVSVNSFDTQDQARECRDALNAGDVDRASELMRQQQLRRDARDEAEEDQS